MELIHSYFSSRLTTLQADGGKREDQVRTGRVRRLGVGRSRAIERTSQRRSRYRTRMPWPSFPGQGVRTGEPSQDRGGVTCVPKRR